MTQIMVINKKINNCFTKTDYGVSFIMIWKTYSVSVEDEGRHSGDALRAGGLCASIHVNF